MITVLIVIAAVIIFDIILVILMSTLFGYTFVRRSNKSERKNRWVPEKDPRLAPYADKIHKSEEWIDHTLHKTYSIETDDGLILRARYFPAENPRGTIVMMHGYRSGVKYDVGLMAEFYYSLGYNILAPSQRSHGESEGDFITFGVLEADDCSKWVSLANELNPGGDIFLYGVSMGAATVMLTLSKDIPENVRGYIADCGYTSGNDIIKRTALDKIKGVYYFVAKPVVGGLASRAGANINDADCTLSVSKSKLPGLFICGEEDDFVPPEMTKTNYEAAGGEKKLVFFPGAVHATSSLVDTERYQREVKEFLDKYSTCNN